MFITNKETVVNLIDGSLLSRKVKLWLNNSLKKVAQLIGTDLSFSSFLTI